MNQTHATKISCRYCHDQVQTAERTDPQRQPLCHSCERKRERMYRPVRKQRDS